MEKIIELIVSNSMSVVLVGYFIFKDYKFNESILDVLGEVKEALASVKEVVNLLSSYHKPQ